MENLKEKKAARAIREAVSKGKQIKMVVKTDSMSPLLRPGDKAVAKKCIPRNLACGDIILYMIDYVLYAHRFIFKKGNGDQLFLITKPDRATYFDVPIPSSKLMGKVIAVEKSRAYINLDSIFWKAINRFLGHFYLLEAVIFNLLRAVKRRILSQKSS